MATYTACYTKIEAGYMGQLLEWPEVITEGSTLEECRAMLIDAAQEMARAYLETGQVPPQTPVLFEPLPVAMEGASHVD
ncbi:type II toxin-antitoxin system HicB family antitoxin [uncultured Fretibacterium sp.]|uniref:type II toxin-antitoxin system HicB family antitoxin n=1 Tax=uncultured Fretibacterium sp. TaxID=1678694 RepID=UPI0026197481|nr:type II toxin-antitoxin system HicB family antitoxin [uncultured Fretibacterium sp.]